MTARAQNAEQSKQRSEFDAFLEARASTGKRIPASREREALFNEFVQWQRR